MLRRQATEYGPAIAEILSANRLCELDAGTLDSRLANKISSLTPGNLFPHANVVDDEMAAACLAGLWLYADGLDQSHEISQRLETPTGSFWHGMMHRREGDFSNSKYWFRRVGRHPVFEPLAREVSELAGTTPPPQATRLANAATWDPIGWIDLCQMALSTGPSRRATETPLAGFCRQVQAVEWGLLFDYCYRMAVKIDVD